ncbi:hypothetical protein PEPS_45430 (plasmid) [Persicobacter psychrovividus]|uniref:Uncharacterized protein n=1 Tax=Persicobacter psychrovividus TaxID=387638 RepID=A0ABM7VML1_9BACT|nr:hypothetical protein PEPS_45430 [Persicobacter psychrovividus]
MKKGNEKHQPSIPPEEINSTQELERNSTVW